MKAIWTSAVLLVATTLLMSCGKEAEKRPTAYRYFSNCSNRTMSPIRSLDVQYAKSTNRLLVSAFFQRDTYPSSDFFYFSGPLEDRAKLEDPIGRKPALELRCAEKDCHRYSFSLDSEAFHQSETVNVERFNISKLVSKRDESVSTQPNVVADEEGRPIGRFRTPEQTWHYGIERGFSAPESSLITTCLGNRPVFTLYLSINEQTSLGPSYYAISGELHGKKYSVDALQNVDGRPISGGIGALEFTTDETNDGIRIKTPSSEVQLTLEPLPH